MKEITSNSNQQQLLTYLAAEGKNAKEISEALGMSQKSVKAMLTDERIDFDIKHLRYKLYGKGIKEKFQEMLPKAQEAVAEILDNPNTKSNLKFQVAQEVFDRSLGKPKQTVEHEGSLLRAVFEKLDGSRNVSEIIDGEVVLERTALPESDNPNTIVNPMDEWINKNM